MEVDLTRSREHLSRTLGELNTIEELKIGWTRNTEIECELVREQQFAGSARRKVESLHTFSKWKHLAINASVMSFALVGQYPKACILLSCSISSSGVVRLEATTDSSLYERTGGSVKRHLKYIGIFVETRVLTLCASICLERLDHPTQIGSYLRKLEWEFGRIEDTAAEIAMIRQRYKAVLKQSESTKSDFELVVMFGKPPKLQATFIVSSNFLFSPLNVVLDTLEGPDNSEDIQKLLVKKAKPGFGCLARTCGILCAFVR